MSEALAKQWEAADKAAEAKRRLTTKPPHSQIAKLESKCFRRGIDCWHVMCGPMRFDRQLT